MIEVWTDGSCYPNPGGRMGWGVVIKVGPIEGWGPIKLSGQVPPARGNSNNYAEFMAVAKALSWLKERGFSGAEIVLRSDSTLLVNMLRRRAGGKPHPEWIPAPGQRAETPPHGKLYRPAFRECVARLSDFPRARFEWIGRGSNQEADALTR